MIIKENDSFNSLIPLDNQKIMKINYLKWIFNNNSHKWLIQLTNYHKLFTIVLILKKCLVFNIISILINKKPFTMVIDVRMRIKFIWLPNLTNYNYITSNLKIFYFNYKYTVKSVTGCWVILKCTEKIVIIALKL